MTKLTTEARFTRLPNDLLETLVESPFSGQEFSIIFTIIRRTVGWHKPADYISLSQFANATGLAVTRCSQVISRLSKYQVISVLDRKGPRGTKKYSINPTAKWTLSKKRHYHKKESIGKVKRHLQKSENDTFRKLQEQKKGLQKKLSKETVKGKGDNGKYDGKNISLVLPG